MMKIDVNEVGNIRLKEVYNGVEFVCESGERIAVCMRDDAFEICVINGSYSEWFSVSSKGIRSLDGVKGQDL